MGEHLEQELKFSLVGRDEFERVLARLGPPQAVVDQVNHYFSASAGQVSPDWVLRVRREDELHELTLKLGRSQRQGYFESVEVNCPLDPEQAAHLLTTDLWSPELWDLPPLLRLRQEFELDRLVLLGSVQNLRHRCPQQGWVAELDITTFPGGRIDYELEVETSQVELVQQALQPLSDLLTVQAKTKFRRFLECL
jgi:uncharacterized protein YjbK